METINNFEFNVQVWFEDDEWNYSVVQEFQSQGSNAFEPIAYGTATHAEEAFRFAAEAVKEFFNA